MFGASIAVLFLFSLILIEGARVVDQRRGVVKVDGMVGESPCSPSACGHTRPGPFQEFRLVVQCARSKLNPCPGDEMRWAEGREVIEKKIIYESVAERRAATRAEQRGLSVAIPGSEHRRRGTGS